MVSLRTKHKMLFINEIKPELEFLKQHHYSVELTPHPHMINNNIIEFEKPKRLSTLVFMRIIRAKTDRNKRKTDVVVESCVIVRLPENANRVLDPPVDMGSFVELNEYIFSWYKRDLLQPNYCCYCDQYFKNLKSHCKCNKHRNQIIKCVDDGLKYKLNNDCVRFICDYL